MKENGEIEETYRLDAVLPTLKFIIEKDALLNACKEIFEGEMANKNIQIVEETFSSLVKLRKK